jgi:hypothetical protein
LAYRPAARHPDVPANNYVRTRDVALRMGVDALGSPRSVGNGSAGDGSAGAMTYIDWLAGWNQPEIPPDGASTTPPPNM